MELWRQQCCWRNAFSLRNKVTFGQNGLKFDWRSYDFGHDDNDNSAGEYARRKNVLPANVGVCVGGWWLLPLSRYKNILPGQGIWLDSECTHVPLSQLGEHLGSAVWIEWRQSSWKTDDRTIEPLWLLSRLMWEIWWKLWNKWTSENKTFTSYSHEFFVLFKLTVVLRINKYTL